MRRHALPAVLTAGAVLFLILTLALIFGPPSSGAQPSSPALSPTEPSVPVTTGRWTCRQAETRAGTQLDVAGTVCARLVGAKWEGKASLRLTSRGAVVDGTATFVFDRLPEEPGFDLVTVPVHLPANGSISLPLTLTAADPPGGVVTGGLFRVAVMANWTPGNGSGPEASLSSPIVWRDKPVGKPRTDGATSRPVCAKGAVDRPSGTATYTYCVRQEAGRLLGSGTITYRTDATTPFFLTVGQALDADRRLWPGQTVISSRVTTSTIELPPSTTPTTVALPPMQTQLLTTDRTAQAYTIEALIADVSKVLTLR